MISEKMQAAINDQINAETYSAYLYLSMGAYFDDLDLGGFANWMKIQAQEELLHATKFYDFLVERGGKVLLCAIDGPPTEWDSPLAVFEAVYAHECKVTGLINDLVALAREQNDNASRIFLQWFVTEQVEEESTADGLVQKLKLIGKDGQGLFMMDREPALRIFTPPTQDKQA